MMKIIRFTLHDNIGLNCHLKCLINCFNSVIKTSFSFNCVFLKLENVNLHGCCFSKLFSYTWTLDKGRFSNVAQIKTASKQCPGYNEGPYYTFLAVFEENVEVLS